MSEILCLKITSYLYLLEKILHYENRDCYADLDQTVCGKIKNFLFLEIFRNLKYQNICFAHFLLYFLCFSVFHPNLKLSISPETKKKVFSIIVYPGESQAI